MFYSDWVLALTLPPITSVFILGVICGALALLILGLLLFIAFTPMEKISRYESENATSWEERKQKASTLISTVRAPMVSALTFSSQCCTLGFSVALHTIRFGFSIGTLLIIGSTHLTSHIPRANATVRFIAEVVGYAEMITVSVVSLNSTLTHVGLQTTLQALHLGEHMSIPGILSLLTSTGFWGSFSHSTLNALSETKDLFANEYTNSLALPLFSEQKNLTLHIRFSLGTYGEKGLKFLGILPYGSATNNNEAFLRLTNIQSSLDIISTDFEGSLYSPGYVLSVDRDSKSIILAVRGTIWPHDFLTDLICVDESLEGGGSAHSGMWKSALNLTEKVKSTIYNLLSRKKYEDYKLTLTGHSLGAGVAALIVYIWSHLERYPNLSLPSSMLKNLHCYGYGCPAILTSDLANSLTNKVTSVLIGNDMVPRFSLRSFREMRDRVLNELVGSRGEGEEEEYTTSVNMPVLLPAGKIVWIDDSSEDNHVFYREPKDFDTMNMCSCSFEAHMPQNYFLKMNEKVEKGFYASTSDDTLEERRSPTFFG
ncbi:hypothetical protein TL16_g08343 [Triparma laevis f. inornata]|uniref:sn-1-specific diacylglycerol lipase n=1 Tax=Triparma laevis f. inornata TaxID=1714386 RepID=A0A9W7AVV9_9STRA|nr:hypothetical protein TL16_g08343 [Triparma laevis f. inornata]